MIHWPAGFAAGKNCTYGYHNTPFSAFTQPVQLSAFLNGIERSVKFISSYGICLAQDNLCGGGGRLVGWVAAFISAQNSAHTSFCSALPASTNLRGRPQRWPRRGKEQSAKNERERVRSCARGKKGDDWWYIPLSDGWWHIKLSRVTFQTWEN